MRSGGINWLAVIAAAIAVYALGFVITGVVYLIIGGIFIITAKNRLAKQDIVPNRTVDELRKDKEWLKN